MSNDAVRSRRDFLRLLGEVCALAATLAAAGCGGRGSSLLTPPPTPLNPNTPMPNEQDSADRLSRARLLLDDAEVKRAAVSDPFQNAQIATQIAAGNALVALAERLATLGEYTRSVSDSVSYVDNINSTLDGVKRSLDDIDSSIEDVETAVRISS